MAKITSLPAQATIDHYKGCVDFYTYRGQPCARKWPHWTKRVPEGDEAANQQAFAYIARAWRTLPAYIRRQYYIMAVGSSGSPRDFFARGWWRGLAT